MIVYGVGPLTARTVSGGLVVNFLDGRRPPGALPETRQPDAAPPRLWGRAMAEDPDRHVVIGDDERAACRGPSCASVEPPDGPARQPLGPVGCVCACGSGR